MTSYELNLQSSYHANLTKGIPLRLQSREVLQKSKQNLQSEVEYVLCRSSVFHSTISLQVFQIRQEENCN